MKKTYVLDTNVLLSDPNALYAFEDNDVVIPLTVLEELDHQKNRMDEAGRAARQVSRQLDDMRQDGNLNDGIKLPDGGGVLRVGTLVSKNLKNLPHELQDVSIADNAIIALTLELHKHLKMECILVSKDINVRVKCDALGIKSQDYLKMRITEDSSEIYRGVQRVQVPQKKLDEFYANNMLQITQEIPANVSLYPNQFIVMKNLAGESGGALARVSGKDGTIRPLLTVENAFGLKPRNTEQKFALDLLFDNAIKLVTLVGASGTGKTLLAIAAGMHHVLSEHKYDKLIITRPVQPVGRDIGFLPGTMEEKMEPWIAPIKDNLSFLIESSHKKARKEEPYIDLLFQRGKIEVEAITFIRGRSIPNAYIIIDEAQNLSLHELKTIITRVGEGTKIVLTGDLDQIDNTHVDVYTNGLTYAVERFKEHGIAGHVTLLKGERSELATLASKIL